MASFFQIDDLQASDPAEDASLRHFDLGPIGSRLRGSDHGPAGPPKVMKTPRGADSQSNVT
jgi:hypothetical protein